MELPRLDGKTASAADAAALLESHGAVVIDDLLDPTAVDRLRSDLDRRDGGFLRRTGILRGGAFDPKRWQAAGRIRSRSRPRGASSGRRRRADAVEAVVPAHRPRHVHEHQRGTAPRSPHAPGAVPGPASRRGDVGRQRLERVDPVDDGRSSGIQRLRHVGHVRLHRYERRDSGHTGIAPVGTEQE